MRQRQLGFGHADQRHRLCGGDRHLQRARAGHADVLAGQNHQPAGDEPRVLPGDQHAGQIVQRGIDVGTAHRFDEGADDVVVLVAVTVVAHRGFVHRPLDGLHADQLAGRLGCLGRYFQRGQGAPGVAGRELHQQVDGLRRYRDCPAQAAGSSIARCTTARVSSAVSGRSCRISDRDSSGATTENDGFSVVAATNSTTRCSTADSRASCWVLENRCTSSMNSTVCSP